MIGMILISLMPILRWVVALWTGRCWPDYSQAKTELFIGVWLFLVADRTEGERSPVSYPQDATGSLRRRP